MEEIKVNERELRYYFFNLNFIQQTMILIELYLLENNDEGKLYRTIFDEIIVRAKQSNQLYKLWMKVNLY